MAPRLLEELALTPDEVLAKVKAKRRQSGLYVVHTLALYFAGLFEESRAWPLIVRFFGTDSHVALEVTGDTVTEHLHAILARTYDGSDLSPLKAIIEDPTAVRPRCLPPGARCPHPRQQDPAP